MKRLLPILFLFFSLSLFTVPKVHAAGTVIQFGDSLTSGMEQNGLEDKYKTAGFTPVVPGGGFTGRSISQMLPEIDNNAGSIKSASAVVVELGTNPGGNTYAGSITSDMQQFVGKIRTINSSVQIYWVNVMIKPTAKTSSWLSDYSARNKAIAGFASANNIRLIDWFHAISPQADPTNLQAGSLDPNNWITDTDLGIHMGSTGYTNMASIIVSAVSSGGSGSAGPSGTPPPVSGPATKCPGTVVSLGYEKKLLPISENTGRPGRCITPKKIVMHDTESSADPNGIYQYFASGSEGRGVGTQFVIGTDGKVLQMAETLDTTVEVAYGTYQYNEEAINVELVSPHPFANRAEVPNPQYQAAVTLVRQLMGQYNIPLSDKDYTWEASSDQNDPNSGLGVFGHYQLNPRTRSDPGEGFLRDFLNDVKMVGPIPPTNNASLNNQTLSKTSACVMTIVGKPIVPPEPPPDCDLTSRAGNPNNDLVKAGEDLKDAYGACGRPPYKTTDHSGLLDCLKSALSSKGYAQDKIDAFHKRFGGTIITSDDTFCTQCLGFVGLSMSLITGTTDTLIGYNSAANVAALDGFTVAGQKWVRVNDSGQPGDIAAYPADGHNPFGHIVIVKEVRGANIVSIESNGAASCTVTDYRGLETKNYHLYRKQ